MSYLNTTTPSDATGEVAAIYQEITAAFGGVPSIIQALSTQPFYLKQQWEWIKHTIHNPDLSGALQAVIRMTVSQATACAYCIDMNAGMLINMFGWTAEQVAATQADPANANLDEREKALLLFVLKAVKDSTSTTQADVDALRAFGYADNAIFEGLAIGARMVAADLISNALHVERDF
ncbi:MAG: hypothetical protein RI964_494 [Pseudomonadota bacterium]|jgi:uncharacterized peroxidase-related enzyme